MSLVSISSDSGEEYTVEKILAKRMVNGKPEYQIKWQNYPVSEATWEPLSNLKYVLGMVKEFEKNLDNGTTQETKPKKNKAKTSSSSDSEQQRQRKSKKPAFMDEDNTSSSQEPSKKSRIDTELERQSAQKVTSIDKEKQKSVEKPPEPPKKQKDVQKDREILRELENARPQTQSIQKQRQTQPPKEEGCYEDNDSAKEILNLRKNNEKKTLEFQIAWKPRPNQKTPMPSWIADSMLKIHNPEVLCDYLLKKIKWPKPSNE